MDNPEDGPMVEGELQLTLPSPVSCNRYWRTFRGRQVVSSEARAYKALVGTIARLRGCTPAAGPVSLTIVYHPRKPKKATGRPVRRLDLDNSAKVGIDALNGVAFLDDSQVVELHVLLGDPVPGGALNVHVEEKC